MLWLFCGACRNGQRAAAPAGLRCYHQHRQVRAGDVWVDEGIFEDVTRLRRSGVDTFTSCEGSDSQRRYITLGDKSQVEYASQLLPTYQVVPASGGYLPTLVKVAA